MRPRELGAGAVARFLGPGLLDPFDATVRDDDAFDVVPPRAGEAPRAEVRRPLALLDDGVSSAAVLSLAGFLPGGLLVTTAVGRS